MELRGGVEFGEEGTAVERRPGRRRFRNRYKCRPAQGRPGGAAREPAAPTGRADGPLRGLAKPIKLRGGGSILDVLDEQRR